MKRQSKLKRLESILEKGPSEKCEQIRSYVKKVTDIWVEDELERSGRVRRKEIVKILTGEVSAGKNLEKERMMRERYSESRINSRWGQIDVRVREESGFLVSQLESHLLG